MEAEGESRFHYALGCVHQAAGRLDAALQCFTRATQLRDTDGNAWYGRGLTQHSLGQLDAARESFEQVLRIDPDHVGAAHMRAALSSRSVSRPSEAFVRELFDGYAERFDDHLCGQLGYRAPELVLEAVRAASRASGLRVLDLGCGTGLFGALIRPLASELVGVDLSPRMLEKARQRSCYDQLREQELNACLAGAEAGAFELVAAVDVFGYLGELDEVFQSAHRVLVSGGLLAFTVEAPDAEESDIELAPTGRHRHAASYAERLGRAAGFEVASIRSAALRFERGRPCPGSVIVLTR